MTADASFHPAFVLGVRDGLTRHAALNPAPVAPEVRLLVPVDVQALVVRPEDTWSQIRPIPADVVPTADVATRVIGADRLVAGDPLPPPFTAAPDRAPGVHLHWALPDGLTATRADGTYRPLPNRWLVARLTGGFPRPTRFWVVASDRATVGDLQGWTEPGVGAPPYRHPHVPPEQLTAVTGGEPGWAAVYDNVAGRFGFHDPWPAGRPLPGPITYVVIGWYAQPDLDPLWDGDDPSQLLAELGWSVDLDRMAAAQRDAAAAAAAVVDLGVVPGSAVEAGTTPRLDGLVGDDAAVTSEPRPWWPRQTVYHGVVYGVLFGVTPTDPVPDPRPARTDVDVAVGATAVDATAGLVAARLAAGPDPPPVETAEVQYGAFAYSITGALSEPTGVARLAEELHARAFDAAPGGDRTEKVLDGDPFEDLRDPVLPTPATSALRAKHPGGAAGPVRLAFVGSGSEAADLLALRTEPARIAPPPDPRRVEERTVPLPRFFAPQDPVVLLGNLRRSLRHGYDGRFSPDERLRCRLSGDTVTTIAGVDGRRLIDAVPAHGAMPREAGALVVEAAVEDPFVVYDEDAVGLLGLPYSLVQPALQAERLLYLLWLSRPRETTPLLQYSLKDGTAASPAGVTIWRQPWVPLLLEWEVETSLATDLAGWRLDELDFTASGGTAAVPPQRLVDGRTLLTPATTKALSDAIAAFCDAEDTLDRDGRGQLSEADEAILRQLASSTGYTDFLAAAISDLRARLLGFATGITREGTPPSPHGEALLVRAGRARLRRLRVVDAFGRYLTLIDDPAPPQGNTTPVVARGLRGNGAPGTVAGTMTLPPRINQPARLMLRLMDAGDDGVEAAVDQSRPDPPNPVAGWLLTDHADDAVELFDPAGEPLGQLRHDPLTGAVGWEGPPGDRGPIGLAPGWAAPGLRHLAALARTMLEMDAAERAAGLARTDTPLQALLRVIDTTAETIADSGRSEHLAQLVGHPVAVVRATLRLDIVREPVFADLTPAEAAARADAWRRLAATAFPVRLGSLTRTDDGLYGYVVDDDYTRLRVVDESVAQQAVDSGARRGDLGGAAAAATRPIQAPYVASGPPLLWIRAGQTIRLTLLQDAAAKVHATCGLLPRKSVELLRDWTAPALARIMPSFRVGPVLVDQQEARLPITTLLAKGQDWTRRTSETAWRDDPIVAATQQALLPSDAAVLEEGYLRLRTDGDA